MKPRVKAPTPEADPIRLKVALKMAALPDLPPASLERQARAVGMTVEELLRMAGREEHRG